MGLDLASCRLMTGELVDRFNRLEATFGRAGGSGPRSLGERPDVKALNQALGKLRGLLERDYFRIGFIGPSQTGKSTTVPNLLDIPDREAPTPGGAGGPTTSAVTRVRPIPPGSAPTVTLQYMSLAEFEARQAAVCDLLQLDQSKPVEALIREIQGRLAPGAAHFDRQDDHKYLLRLLQSYRANREWLGREEPGRYDARNEYLCHSEDATRYALLRQVIIGFPTDRIDPRLEIIDLPGLGTSTESDDLLTTAFLAELDGAFVFQQAKQVKTRDAATLLKRLHEEFNQGLKSRVWSITTRFDDLDPNQFDGDNNGLTILDLLAKFLSTYGVAEDKALLIGNHMYQALLGHRAAATAEEPEGRFPEPTREILDDSRYGTKFRFGPDGKPTVPPGFLKYPKLAEAYKAVCQDGGIARLRGVIRHQVGEAVQAEVREQVDARIKALAAAMLAQVTAARERSHMPLEDLRGAALWERAIEDKVVTRLRRDRDLTGPPASEIREGLTKLLDDILPRRFAPAEFAGIHLRNCNLLASSGLEHARAKLGELFDRVGVLLSEIDVPALESGPHRDPRLRWAEAIGPDRASDAWYRDVFQSFSAEGFVIEGDGAEGGKGMQAEHYQQIMHKKIASVVYEFVATAFDRIVDSLEALRAELRILGSENSPIAPAEDQLYGELIGELKQLM